MAIANSTDRWNGLVASLAIKAPCVAVAITNITLSGEQTVNGVAVVSGDRVLVTAQTSAVNNGIYNASSSAWTRAADFDGNRDVTQGTMVSVVNGSGGANLYEVTTANPIVIGSSSITFTLRYGANVRYDITAAETSAAVTIVNDNYKPGVVPRYGTNTTPGSTSMAAAAQAALDQAQESGGSPVYFPADNYLIDAQLTVTLSGASDHEQILIYGDGAKSMITSTVIGTPTLKISDGKAVRVRDLNFQGNTLTGASGNGHAIAFTDTLPNSGTFYPQNCDVSGCFINGFRGNDVEITLTTTGVTTIAAGVYVGPGLGNFVDRNDISNCGTGIHFDETQNSSVTRNLISICDNWGVELDEVGDGCSVHGNDIVNCGVDGNGDPKIFSGTLNFAGILARSFNTIAIHDNKFKVGQAISQWASERTVIRDNFFRVDAPFVVSDSWAIQSLISGSIVIDSNDFEYLAGTGTNTANAIHIDSNSSYPFTATVTNNGFNHSEFTGYDVKYEGSSANDSNFIINHTGNSHGPSRAGRITAVVEDCIVLDTLNAHGQIVGNDFTVTGNGAAAGGVITDCLDISAIGSAASLSNLRINNNKARVYLAGGTITNDIELFQDNTPGTFAAADATPDISWKSVWHTDSGSLTITDFDGYPVNGRSITVISEGAVTFDVTGTSLKGGTTDLVTAAGDVTQWALDVDGFTWRLIGFMDDSVDNSAGA